MTNPSMGESQREEMLASISAIIRDQIDEAVTAKKEAGLDELWRQLEEAYIGIDDANRSDFSHAKWAKPVSMDGPVTNNYARRDNSKSNAFVKLTARYVDAGAAKLSEISIPIDDKPFEFTATPVPELVASLDDKTPLAGPDGNPLMVNADPAEVPQPQAMQGGMPPSMPMQPGQPPQGMPPQQKPLTKADLAKKKIATANEMAEKAAQRIYDWMVESNYGAEIRKAHEDAARIGTGVVKGPVPVVVKKQAVKKANGVVTLEIVEKIMPATCWVDPHNLFPDPACGENIHHGDYIVERDYLAKRKVKELKGQPGYIASQIDKVLKEGPGKCNEDTGRRDTKADKKRYEIWYYTGSLAKEHLRVLDTPGIEEIGDDQDEVFCIISMINDSIIRATINPMDSGKFPYHVMPWKRRAGSWAGVGPGEQCMMPQATVNAATRALFNNAGISSGSQIVLDQLAIIPADGSWTITPNKVWYLTGDGAERNVNTAFGVFQIPNMGQQLMEVINYGSKLAEEATNLPLLSQGQIGTRVPDTFGATELLDNNANTLLRAIVASYDDNILNPLVKQYYEWLLLDPEVPDDEKGDFDINTKGSALVERAIQEQFLQVLAQMSANPAFDLDQAKLAAEIIKSKRMDPRTVQLSEEDKAKRAAIPPQPPPQIAAAQIRADADMKKTEFQAQQDQQKFQAEQQADMQKLQFEQQHDQQKTQFVEANDLQIAQMDNQTQQVRIKTDLDRDTAFVQAETIRDQQNHVARMEEVHAKIQLAQLDYANQRNISLEQVKADMAETAMKLQTQKELSLAAMDADKEKHYNPMPQVATPPTEPLGRADSGQAYAE